MTQTPAIIVGSCKQGLASAVKLDQDIQTYLAIVRKSDMILQAKLSEFQTSSIIDRERIAQLEVQIVQLKERLAEALNSQTVDVTTVDNLKDELRRSRDELAACNLSLRESEESCQKLAEVHRGSIATLQSEISKRNTSQLVPYTQQPVVSVPASNNPILTPSPLFQTNQTPRNQISMPTELIGFQPAWSVEASTNSSPFINGSNNAMNSAEIQQAVQSWPNSQMALQQAIGAAVTRPLDSSVQFIDMVIGFGDSPVSSEIARLTNTPNELSNLGQERQRLSFDLAVVSSAVSAVTTGDRVRSIESDLELMTGAFFDTQEDPIMANRIAAIKSGYQVLSYAATATRNFAYWLYALLFSFGTTELQSKSSRTTANLLLISSGLVDPQRKRPTSFATFMQLTEATIKLRILRKWPYVKTQTGYKKITVSSEMETDVAASAKQLAYWITCQMMLCQSTLNIRLGNETFYWYDCSCLETIPPTGIVPIIPMIFISGSTDEAWNNKIVIFDPYGANGETKTIAVLGIDDSVSFISNPGAWISILQKVEWVNQTIRDVEVIKELALSFANNIELLQTTLRTVREKTSGNAASKFTQIANVVGRKNEFFTYPEFSALQLKNGCRPIPALYSIAYVCVPGGFVPGKTTEIQERIKEQNLDEESLQVVKKFYDGLSDVEMGLLTMIMNQQTM